MIFTCLRYYTFFFFFIDHQTMMWPLNETMALSSFECKTPALCKKVTNLRECLTST